jgi:hypothetical protein
MEAPKPNPSPFLELGTQAQHEAFCLILTHHSLFPILLPEKAASYPSYKAGNLLNRNLSRGRLKLPEIPLNAGFRGASI